MKLLITGAFGNVGQAIIEEAFNRGHEVTVFEVENKKTLKAAKKFRNKIKTVIFGDIRNFEDAKKAVQDCEGLIHLAAILPPLSKKMRELTMEVNFGGTVNLVNAINETKREIGFVFTSSASVMGPTQLQDRLVTRHDPLVVTGNYEESKIKCENFLKENADNYLIFRLAGVLPEFSFSAFTGSFSAMEELFDMHPDMRLEMITGKDVATALVTGVEKLKTGKTPKNQAYILGGGKEKGWQLTGREFVCRMFGSMSMPVPDIKYFTPDVNTYHLDWYDTKEAQQQFDFQKHTIEEHFKQVKKTFRIVKLPILLFRGYILKKLVKMSPYYKD